MNNLSDAMRSAANAAREDTAAADEAGDKRIGGKVADFLGRAEIDCPLSANPNTGACVPSPAQGSRSHAARASAGAVIAEYKLAGMRPLGLDERRQSPLRSLTFCASGLNHFIACSGNLLPDMYAIAQNHLAPEEKMAA